MLTNLHHLREGTSEELCCKHRDDDTQSSYGMDMTVQTYFNNDLRHNFFNIIMIFIYNSFMVV